MGLIGSSWSRVDVRGSVVPGPGWDCLSISQLRWDVMDWECCCVFGGVRAFNTSHPGPVSGLACPIHDPIPCSLSLCYVPNGVVSYDCQVSRGGKGLDDVFSCGACLAAIGFIISGAGFKVGEMANLAPEVLGD
ncbi:hypothetical protein Tco_1546986 [Tanacetum coccineum]